MKEALKAAGFTANPISSEPPFQLVLDARHTALARIKEGRCELTIVRDKNLPGDTVVALAITGKGGLDKMIADYRKELILVNRRLKREKK